MVAQAYKVPRQKQDEYALISHVRAEKVAFRQSYQDKAG